MAQAVKVHVLTPFALDKNLGKAYNDAMRMIPDNDWACLIDYDVQFLTPDAIAHMHEYVRLNPDAGMLTCFTNRIGCGEQLLNGFSENSDMLHHLQLAEKQKKNLYKVTELKSLTSGFLMLISKKTWKGFPFEESGKCLGVDNAFCKALLAGGKKVLRMDGIYVFHTYRLGKGRFDTSHLKRKEVKIIYTAIFDNYDTLQPVKPAKGWRYICFTNTDLKADGWEVYHKESGPKENRRVKLMPHRFLPPHDVSIYHDGNISIECNPDELIKGKNFCVMTHPHRNNLRDELAACIRLKKANADLMTKQVNTYLESGYNGEGMSSNGVIIRTNTDINRSINEAWWKEVEEHSHRDQLSLGYVFWKWCKSYETIPYLQGMKYRKHGT